MFYGLVNNTLAFIGICVCVSLSACSNSFEPESNSDDRESVAIPIPSAIAKSRINPDALDLLVSVNGLNVPMTPPDNSDLEEDTTWTGKISVPAGQTLQLSVRWSTQGIDLAILDNAIDALTADDSVSFLDSDYRYPDDDRDGFTNLQELNATPPTEVNNPDSIPSTSDDGSPMAVLSHLTYKNITLSTNPNETTSGTISFTNTGDIPLEYSISNNNTFFSVSPSGGSVSPGSTESLTVTGQCGGNAVVLSSEFFLFGNFLEVPPIRVTLDCNGSLPSVFSEGNYTNTLIPIFGVINTNWFAGAYFAYVQLVLAVIDEKPDDSFLTEVSRGEETLDNNGDPVYSVKYDCNAGGSVDVERQGRQFDAELFNCQLGNRVFNGKLLNSGFIESPRLFFATFSDIRATTPDSESTHSGSHTYSSDSTRSAFRFDDIQYTFHSESFNVAISNGYTAATVNSGIYQSEFEFDVIGSITNNQNFKVKSDIIDIIVALEGFYYTQGNFTVNAVDGDGEMKIEPGKNNAETFQLSISENGTPTALLDVPWSDNYYFRCGIDNPTIDATTYLCRNIP